MNVSILLLNFRQSVGLSVQCFPSVLSVYRPELIGVTLRRRSIGSAVYSH